MSDHVLGPEAVPHSAQLLDPHLGPHLDDARIHDRVDRRRQVRNLLLAIAALQPFLEIEIAGSVEGDGVSVEEVGHEDVVAILGELVGEELCVGEVVPDHVCDDEDAPFGGGLGGFGEVGLDLADFAHGAGRRAVVLDALVAAATWLVGCHGLRGLWVD